MLKPELFDFAVKKFKSFSHCSVFITLSFTPKTELTVNRNCKAISFSISSPSRLGDSGNFSRFFYVRFKRQRDPWREAALLAV